MAENENKAVCIEEVADNLVMVQNGFLCYFNVVTGEFAAVSDGFDPEMDREVLEKIDASDDYIMLPEKSDIDGWGIMRNFAEDVEDEKARNILLDAIHRKGAFRNFQCKAAELGLRNKYFKYLDEAILEIAMKWCDDNDIPYFHREKQ